jgi:dephospho-CoA kinase
MKWIGLTGGISTGKSTVARLLESSGYPVIDADQISHQLTTLRKEGYLKILSHFGTEILKENQDIDRKKLGQIIIHDPHQKQILESILHPLIQNEVQKKKAELIELNTTMAFYDVPLLFEKKLKDQFDATIYVFCQESIRLKRLCLRDQITEDQARLKISLQMNQIDKIAQSDFCVDNSGSELSLVHLVNHLVSQIEKKWC